MTAPGPSAAPPSPRTTLRTWAELTRISNIPTVFTNVLVGVAFGSGPGAFPWLAFAVTCVAVGLLYGAGMVMNDLFDLEVDRRERPQRALPSGRVSIRAAWMFVLASLIAGPALLYFVRSGAGLLALFLAGLIVAYNWLHAQTLLSVFLMGMCRAAVYGVAIFAVADRPPRGFEYPVAALVWYVALLSIVARREASSGPLDVRWPAWILPWIPLPIAIPVALTPAVGDVGRALAIAAIVMFVGWTLFGVSRLYRLVPRVVHAVLIWLAGICLLDAIWLALSPRSELALLAWAGFALTVFGHRRVRGT